MDGWSQARELQGSLGNLGDFEELLSDCVELSELATVMCTEIVPDATRKEANIVRNRDWEV